VWHGSSARELNEHWNQSEGSSGMVDKDGWSMCNIKIESKHCTDDDDDDDDDSNKWSK